MIIKALSLVCIGVLAFAATTVVYICRREKWPKFRAWWDAEGVPIFMLLSILFLAVAAGRGCIPPSAH